MPTTTPLVKVEAVKALGAETVLVGDSYSDAYQHAVRLQQQQGLTFAFARRHGVLGDAQVIVRPEFTGLGYFDDSMTELVVEEDGRRFALSNLREKLLHEHIT
jgi:hypothetical protein